MKIVIIGAGAVGLHLAKTLSWEGHDIIIVDHHQEVVDRAGGSMDVMAIRGSGTSISTLIKAGVETADLLIAVTSVDEVNIVASMLAEQMGVRTRIARVRNQEYSKPDTPVPLKKLGITQIIHPELEAARAVGRLIRYPHTIDVVECADGKMTLVCLRIEPESEVIGTSLMDLTPRYPDIPLRVVAVVHEGKTTIPTGESRIMAGDTVYVIVHIDNVDRVFQLAGKPEVTSHDVMILGGGMIGRMVAEELEKEKDYNIKIIESEEAKSQMASQRLVNTMVVRSSEGIDIDVMAIEGLSEMGVFAALTDDDENNIVTSLFARHLGVERTITLITKPEYMPITRAIGLDAAINERLLTSDAILKYLRGGRILAVSSLRGIDAEIIEFEVTYSSKVINKKLRDVRFPEGSIVGAILHDGEVSVAVGESMIQTGDQVVVFCQEKAIPKLEKLF